MPQSKKTLEEIEHIINTSRCGEEDFFADGKGAAIKIMAYLVAEKLIVTVPIKPVFY